MELNKELDPRCQGFYEKTFPDLSDSERLEKRLEWIKNSRRPYPEIEEMRCPICDAVTGHKLINDFWTCVNCGTPLK